MRKRKGKKGVLLRSSLSPKRRRRFLKSDPNPAPMRDEEVRLRRSRYVVYTRAYVVCNQVPSLCQNGYLRQGKRKGGRKRQEPPLPAHTYSTRMRGGKQGGRGSGAGINGTPQPTPPDPIVFPPSSSFPPSVGAKLRKLANVLRGAPPPSFRLVRGVSPLPPTLVTTMHAMRKRGGERLFFSAKRTMMP